MVAAVAPYIDGAISKNAFEPAFADGWRLGVKGLAAFRPNRVLGTVLRRH
jgi:ribonucleoside-diphosphate reductase alpha chain